MNGYHGVYHTSYRALVGMRSSPKYEITGPNHKVTCQRHKVFVTPVVEQWVVKQKAQWTSEGNSFTTSNHCVCDRTKTGEISSGWTR